MTTHATTTRAFDKKLADDMNNIAPAQIMLDVVMALNPKETPGRAHRRVAAHLTALWEKGFIVIDAKEHIRGRLRLGGLGLSTGGLLGFVAGRIL